MSTANEIQVGGVHYKGKPIQPWDYVIQNNLGYLEGNIIKYVSRHKQKGGLQDLEKAKHYLDKLIEVVADEIASMSTPPPHPKMQDTGEPGRDYVDQ